MIKLYAECEHHNRGHCEWPVTIDEAMTLVRKAKTSHTREDLENMEPDDEIVLPETNSQAEVTITAIEES